MISVVCGIVAGKAFENYGDYKRFNGVASDAKIAFYDIKRTGRDIALPTNLDLDLFLIMYNMGARIMTNSWGDSSKAAYDTKAQTSDRFMFKYPDSLILYAAGNNGDPLQTPEVPNPISSVNSPGIFKNGLTVGAGLNDQQSWLAYTFGAADSSFSPNALARFSSRGPTLDNRLKPEIVAPGNAPNVSYCSISFLMKCEQVYG
jgi:serine protease AprX